MLNNHCMNFQKIIKEKDLNFENKNEEFIEKNQRLREKHISET